MKRQKIAALLALLLVGNPVIARSFEHVATIEGQANRDDKWLR